MLIISIITFMVLIGGIATSLIIYKTVKCPFGIFTIIWNGLFFLYTLNIVDYNPISIEAVIIIIISYIIFGIGSLTQELPKHMIKNNKANIKNKYYYTNIDSIKVGINIAIFFSLLGGFLFLIQAVSILGVGSTINYDAYLFRENLLQQINPLFSFFIYVFSLGGSILMGLLLAKYNIFKKKYLLIFLGPIIVSFFLSSRSFLIISIFCFMAPLLMNSNKRILEVKSKKNKGNKYIFNAIIILLLFFITIGSTRGSFDSFNNSTNLISNIINKSYTYLTGSFAAFSEVLNSWDGELDFGINTFTPFGKLTNLLGITEFDSELIKQIENGREPVFIPYLFNVYSYLWDVISDFGYIGLFIFVWLLGFISSYLWNRCRLHNYITWTDIFLTFISVYLMYGFIASITNYTLIWYGLFYALLVTFLSKKNKWKSVSS